MHSACMKCACTGWERHTRKSWPLTALSFALLANSIGFTNVFPYAPFLIQHFHPELSLSAVGFRAGLVATSHQIGAALMGYPLGMLADAYGRRFTLELGLLACVLPQIAFGAAPSLAFALGARLVGGLFNGVVGTAKAATPELVPPERVAFAMSLISGTWGLGNIFGPSRDSSCCCCLLLAVTHRHVITGPMIGGLLARRWPGELPFLLPNLVSAVIAVVALIGVRCHIPGEAWRGGPDRRFTRPPWARRRHATSASTAASSSSTSSTSNGSSSTVADADAASSAGGAANGGAGSRIERKRAAAEAVGTAALFGGAGSGGGGESGGGGGSGSGGGDGDGGAGGDGGGGGGCCASLRSTPRAALHPIAAYCLVAFHTILYDECYPLWCVAPRCNGGLGLGPAETGGLLSAGGFALIVFQLFVFTPLSRVMTITQACTRSLGRSEQGLALSYDPALLRLQIWLGANIAAGLLFPWPVT